MKKKKLLAMLSVVTLSATMLAGCGSSAAETPEATAPATESTAIVAEETTEAPEETAEEEPVAAESETVEEPEEAVDMSVNNIDTAALEQDFIATIEAEGYDGVEIPGDDKIMIEIVSDYEGYRSLKFESELEFGANDLDYIKYYTAERESGEVVTLDSLLGGDQATYDAITESIKAQMAEEDPDGTTYFVEDFTGVNANSLWYLDDSGALHIAFMEATIAAHALGEVEFTIPADVFDPTTVL